MRVVSDPAEIFSGRCLVVAPHMDDGVLACGGTISMLPDKAGIHVLYATDGSRSPVPPFSRKADPELVAIRASEARDALAALGIPPANVDFLGLPDSGLRRHAERLIGLLADRIGTLEPDRILVPFRYDRHPDHLALNRCAHQALARTGSEAILYEYFVYTRWRLLPRQDVRKYIGDQHLLGVDISSRSQTKREALERFRSQTTRFFPWQRRAILTPERLTEICRTPEIFLRHDPAFPGLAVFPRRRAWIRLVHAWEPRLKLWKDGLAHLLSRG